MKTTQWLVAVTLIGLLAACGGGGGAGGGGVIPPPSGGGGGTGGDTGGGTGGDTGGGTGGGSGGTGNVDTTFDFASQGVQAGVNSKTETTAVIAGYVKDGDGVPVANVTVTIQRLQSSRAASLSTTTDGNGWYCFGNVPPGGYQLTAGGQTAQVTAGANQDVTANLNNSQPGLPTDDELVTAARGALRGEVWSSPQASGEAPAPAPGATVTIVGNGQTVTAAVGADGAFHKGNLPAGSYELTATLEGRVTLSRTVTVSANAVTAVPGFYLYAGDPRGGARFRVADALNNALGGARVSVVGSSATGTTDEGVVVLDLPPGSFQATAQRPGIAAEVMVEFTVQAGVLSEPIQAKIPGIVSAEPPGEWQALKVTVTARPETAKVGEAVEFTVISPTDGAYAWRYEGTGTFVPGEATASHTYATAGSYQVVVEVTKGDQQGYGLVTVQVTAN